MKGLSQQQGSGVRIALRLGLGKASMEAVSVFFSEPEVFQDGGVLSEFKEGRRRLALIKGRVEVVDFSHEALGFSIEEVPDGGFDTVGVVDVHFALQWLPNLVVFSRSSLFGFDVASYSRILFRCCPFRKLVQKHEDLPFEQCSALTIGQSHSLGLKLVDDVSQRIRLFREVFDPREQGLTEDSSELGDLGGRGCQREQALRHEGG